MPMTFSEINATKNVRKMSWDLFPVITFVIYYGEEEWRHETTLYKRLNLDSELKHYVSDYSINLIDLKKLSEDDITDNDIPPLANFCKIIYNNYGNVTKLLKHLGGDNENQDNNIRLYPACRNDN